MQLNNLITRLGLNKYINSSSDKNLVGVFDTSISSLNVGDEIINSSAMEFIEKTFSDKQLLKFSTHAGISSIGIFRANLCNHRIVCGSNILSGTLFKTGQWNLSLLDVLRIKSHILMGVGWINYQSNTSLISKLAYKHILNKDFIHSVRDEYTKEKLKKMGVTNVINTGCPTMWKLTPEHCKKIPQYKSDKVVFTLTDYDKNKALDTFLIETLLARYDDVYFWIQGSGDLKYFKSLRVNQSEIIIISPQLSQFDKLLVNNDIDFIGTRLHAGIRALQHLKRTFIIAVDNRATEKAKDFNLPVISRDNLNSELIIKIDSEYKCHIKINQSAINKWIEQFN